MSKAPDDDYDLRVISLGAGVQSTAMYLRAVRGEFYPIPDAAIFADTQAEPPHVYEQLDLLMSHHQSKLPIHKVTIGSLEKNLYYGGEGRKGFAQIPAFLLGSDGSRGMSRRGCTYQYKIRPIQRAIRDLLGLRPRQRAKGKYRVEQWIGISADEANRQKLSDVEWIDFYYPLLDAPIMSRTGCLEYMTQHGDPLPRKSSCYFCPFHSDVEWLEIKNHYPALWERACKLDEDLRSGTMRASQGLEKRQFLHAARIPLREVNLKHTTDQPSLFSTECAGVCGV